MVRWLHPLLPAVHAHQDDRTNNDTRDRDVRHRPWTEPTEGLGIEGVLKGCEGAPLILPIIPSLIALAESPLWSRA